MTNHHDVFKALAPVDWDTINQDDLKTFLTTIFTEAQTILDSIPIAATSKPISTGRPRSATDPAGPKLPERALPTSHHADHLRKEWKEVQVGPKENPLGVNVYKMSSKDRKGAWFARRSIHEGLSFDQWKLGMQAEFAESLKIQGGAGSGKIRGIGADRKVVDTTLDGCGKMEVYHLSAQFPGPTTPRDFVTLLLSSDSAIDLPAQEGLAKSRYFMLVSKPCNHPECPQRSGYIRGQYESVEFIREIKVAKPLRKVRSSTDLSHGDAAQARQFAEDDLNRDALNRSAHGAGATDGGKRDKTIAFADTEEEELKEKEDFETLVEWLMVTRSDPGGSVPRFMVEKGTPAGIAGDAEKFLKWVQHKKPEELAKAGEQDTEFEDETSSKTEHDQMNHDQKTIVPVSKTNSDSTMKAPEYPQEYEDLPSPGGIYGMISGALSAVAARLPVNPLGSARGGDTDTDPSPSNSSDDDSSDILSFHSADSDLDGDSRLSNTDDNDNLLPPISTSKDGEAQSTHSSESTGGISTSITQHEKELRKLEDKKRKAAEKLERAQERAKNKKGNDSQRDEAAIAKLKEKHDREVQKQEEKYRRDLKRLEEKRAHEKKKAEEKRRKQAEKEVQQNLAMQLEQAKAERDIALKQIDVLKEQVGELQGQNTLLVAKLGKISSPELVDSIKRTDSFKDGKLMDN